MFSTSSSQAEGAARDWAVLSKAFLTDESGAVRAIQAVRADWSSGAPQEMPGSEHELPAQLVLLAMGFLHPEHAVLDDLGLDKDGRGNCCREGLSDVRERASSWPATCGAASRSWSGPSRRAASAPARSTST